MLQVSEAHFEVLAIERELALLPHNSLAAATSPPPPSLSLSLHSHARRRLTVFYSILMKSLRRHLPRDRA